MKKTLSKCVLGLSVASLSAWAQAPVVTPQDIAEVHERMADAHKAMATCLKEGRAIAECRSEMHDKLQKIHGGSRKGRGWMPDEMGCPMMNSPKRVEAGK